MHRTSKWIGILLFAFAASTHVKAGPFPVDLDSGSSPQLLEITSDVDAGIYKILAWLNDENTLNGLIHLEDGTETFRINLDELRGGFPITRRDDRDIIRIQIRDFDPKNGGKIDLHYLYNGIDDTWRTLTLEVERMGQSWLLLADDRSGRRIVSRLFIEGRRLFIGGKLFGVRLKILD